MVGSQGRLLEKEAERRRERDKQATPTPPNHAADATPGGPGAK